MRNRRMSIERASQFLIDLQRIALQHQTVTYVCYVALPEDSPWLLTLGQVFFVWPLTDLGLHRGHIDPIYRILYGYYEGLVLSSIIIRFAAISQNLALKLKWWHSLISILFRQLKNGSFWRKAPCRPSEGWAGHTGLVITAWKLNMLCERRENDKRRVQT